MRIGTPLGLDLAALAITVGLSTFPAPLGAQPGASPAVSIDPDDIGGVVTGPNGPEAGVWVIAETTELSTKYAKSVVTDDAGRYLLPDLPSANYSVWVRGYGLVDSPKVRSSPGRLFDLTATPAPNAKAAADYYPAILVHDAEDPRRRPVRGQERYPPKLTQIDWLKQVKNIGCIGCHQLGQASTRAIPNVFLEGHSHEEAWMRRVQSGQSGEQMVNQLAGVFGGAPFGYYAEWTERIAKGELPHAQPKRPESLEARGGAPPATWIAGTSSSRTDPR